MSNGLTPRRPRSKPQALQATLEERPLLPAGRSRAEPDSRTRDREPTPASSRREIVGKAGSSACGIHRLDAGDNALKVERRAAAEEARREARRLSTNLEERILEAKRRRRFSNPRPRLPGLQGTTSPKGQQKIFRPYNAQKVSEREPRSLRLPSARPPGLAAFRHVAIFVCSFPSAAMLRFYAKPRAMARPSAKHHCQFGAGA